jgi:homoserine O-succinyltransferase
MKLKTHTPKNTPIKHMMMFYKDSKELMKQKFDGMIVTGAPVETIPFENVDYWNEINNIFDWARTHVESTLYLCWGAMAALYHFYDVPKYQLPTKKFGVFPTIPLDEQMPIFRGFDSVFNMPHSRHTEVRRDDIIRVPQLRIIAESPEAGVSIVESRDGREFYILGHLEYNPDTLDKEYKRDLGKRDDVEVPQHYYLNDDPSNEPLVTWRSAANLFYNNWLNYYVYQETPYNIDDIK